jgi:hypothetical protein
VNFKLELLKSLSFPDFPSGSSINFYDEKLFLIGDDASHVLVLDTNYRTIDSIHLFDSPEKRIAKKEKADFETSTILHIKNIAYLLVFGSASKRSRMNLILIDLENEWRFESYNYNSFIKRIKKAGVSEVNIECAALIGDQIVLGNRGNTSSPKNNIIVTHSDFWLSQDEVPITISEIEVTVNGTFVGISEVCYLESQDMLLFTLSTEFTGNSFEDGSIGDSYVGWIEVFSKRIKEPQLKLDGMISLPTIASDFDREKIEGICVESSKDDEIIVHLISDNDVGETKLFKVRMNRD